MGTMGRRDRMEAISEVQLLRALETTSTPLAKRLPGEDLKSLGRALGDLTKRYPSQDMGDSQEVYLEDFEKLALRYSTSAVIEALKELRIKPGQQFFPRPDEVAAEIQHMREVTAERDRTGGKNFPPIEEWKNEWIDCRMQDADTQGMTRDEFIANGYRGIGTV